MHTVTFQRSPGEILAVLTQPVSSLGTCYSSSIPTVPDWSFSLVLTLRLVTTGEE